MAEEKKINDYFNEPLDLEIEFEKYKKAHILKTCVRAKEIDLINESQKELNIPAFLLRDKIREEARNYIYDITMCGGDKALMTYYNEAWELVSKTLP